MTKTTVAAILSSALFFSGNLYAESTLLTNQNIKGSWVLEYTKHSEKSVETVEREDTWIFKENGTVAMTHIPREGGYYDQAPVNYKIEEGQLKISIVGRAGKFDSFSVLNKEERTMTLKARFGSVYQFKKTGSED